MPQPVYNIDSPTNSGRFMHGYRVGINYDTGYGQFPRLDGLYAALRRMPDGYMHVTVYGVPAYYDSRYPPDEYGRISPNFKGNKYNMMQWLLDPSRRGYTLAPDRVTAVGQANTPGLILQFVKDVVTDYPFSEIAAITFWV